MESFQNLLFSPIFLLSVGTQFQAISLNLSRFEEINRFEDSHKIQAALPFKGNIIFRG